MDKILIELDQLFKDNKLNQVVKITKENRKAIQEKRRKLKKKKGKHTGK